MRFSALYFNRGELLSPHQLAAIAAVDEALWRQRNRLPDLGIPDNATYALPPYNGVQAYCDYNAARTT